MNLSFLNFLGLLIGLGFIVWSVWILYNYYQLPAVGRKYKKVNLWIGVLILLIGIADLLKAIKDILPR
jgi:4-hydroxybenzoate polyprenyltransferase